VTNFLIFNSASAREIRASIRPTHPEIWPFCRKKSDHKGRESSWYHGCREDTEPKTGGPKTVDKGGIPLEGLRKWRACSVHKPGY
jgi:hypothetical protein